MSDAFLSSIKKRRSIYSLGKDLPVSKEKIVEIVKEAVTHSPSSFNSQSSRVVVLFGNEHHKFWNIAQTELKKIVPADMFAATEKKLASFKAGAGSILFFEEQEAIAELQKTFPLYAENFLVWSEQASGMAQFAVWTALAGYGVGASLQHYNPVVDEQTRATWDLPSSWKLRAQMPFGSIVSPAAEKPFARKDGRFRVFDS
ncbi:nitroreductase family protein [Burkholderia multivorans]|uniref:nitroreductase family protein n=1 Tax=Burkholderia multivorans TaxID=87883 RepID=UPI0021BF8F82|nr:nitroreductase family protein [Burkholderia multivorans]